MYKKLQRFMDTSKNSKSLFLGKVTIQHTARFTAQRKRLCNLEDSKHSV